MSYADCFLLACAIEQTATIVTGNPEFRMVSHLVSIHWI
jgi:predicted nucleic acid-binding protein